MNPDHVEKAEKYFKDNNYDVYYRNLLNLLSNVMVKFKNHSIERPLNEFFDRLSNKCCSNAPCSYKAQGSADKTIDQCKCLIATIDWTDVLPYKAVEGVLHFAICASYYFQSKTTNDQGDIDSCANNALKAVKLFSWSIGWKRINEELSV